MGGEVALELAGCVLLRIGWKPACSSPDDQTGDDKGELTALLAGSDGTSH
jgi:hypothetical protein